MQRDGLREQAVELRFDLEAREQWPRVLVQLHVARMARHEHLHEVLGLAIGFVALDLNVVDILAVEVADRPLDQAAFFIDKRRGGG